MGHAHCAKSRAHVPGQVRSGHRDWQVSGLLSSEASQAASRRGLPSVGNLRNLSSWRRLGTSKWPAQPLRRPRTGVCRTARGAGAIIAPLTAPERHHDHGPWARARAGPWPQASFGAVPAAGWAAAAGPGKGTVALGCCRRRVPNRPANLNLKAQRASNIQVKKTLKVDEPEKSTPAATSDPDVATRVLAMRTTSRPGRPQ